MPVKYVKRNEYSHKAVEEICKNSDIPRPLGMLLSGRGVKSYDEAVKFLNPSADELCDPFEIYGMSDAVARIKLAIERDEHILIYGDYDCDGLSAISILYSYLRYKISKINYYVPKRHAEGYGLHNIVIEDLTENLDLDLIITVDCGITSKTEVEYIKSKGVDVIVTDHHEPIESLIPDCAIVNAKMDKKGFFEYCGAGVVFKLIEALAGREEALKYVGIAAVGTIADIVPLVGENRIIAKLGLDKINKFDTAPSECMAKKLGRDVITANDIMFRVAPRINALGRLKDATPVVRFFTSGNKQVVNEIVDELEENNKERQLLCENIVSDILTKLKDFDLKNNRIIVMSDKNWNVGILGIAASKLAELFFRPVILFAECEDGILRGSARSNSKINIFECLSACKKYFVAFGGHQAAAGVSILPENLASFSEEINSYIAEKYDIANFYPDVVFDLKFNKEIDYNCVEQFSKLEPCGFGNPTPVFYLEKANLKFVQIGSTPHIKTYYNGTEIVAFNYMQHFESVNSECSFIFTLQNKTYKQKKYTQGVVKSHTMITPKNINEEIVAIRYLLYNLALPTKGLSRPIKRCKLEEIDLNDGIFGNLYIAFSTQTYYNFIQRVKDAGGYLISNIQSSVSINPYNRIILSPSTNFNFGLYNNIYFLDEPSTKNFAAFLQATTNAKIFSVGDNVSIIENIRKLKCKNESEYREIYKLLKRTNVFDAKDFDDLQGKLYVMTDISPFKVISTMYIMIELGLIAINDKEGFTFVKGIQSTLHFSIIYKYLAAI